MTMTSGTATDLPGPEAPERIALVTGASRGLGFAVARALGAAGWQVVALARTVGGLEELADAIEAAGGPNPTLVPLSLADDGGMQRLCLAVHERWGRLDLVVHCAANAPPLSPAEHTAPKDWAQSVEVNLHGTQRVVAMMAPLLRASARGVFVHCGDERAGQPFFGSYGAAKAGAEALVRCWAAETAKTGPRVVVFQPKPMPTALRARFFPGEDRAALTPCEDEAARLIGMLDEAGA